jgi:hypothetical protein
MESTSAKGMEMSGCYPMSFGTFINTNKPVPSPHFCPFIYSKSLPSGTTMRRLNSTLGRTRGIMPNPAVKWDCAKAHSPFPR